ncbi:MAG: ferritin-like domain-containing protein [Thermoanaerobaculia bacterium]
METVNISGAATTKRVLDALNRMIEACKDGEKGYASAAADVRDPRARELFERWAQERAQFAAALEELVVREGGNPEHTGSVGGALRRGWQDLKAAIEGANDRAVCGAVERGEEAGIRAYEEGLREPLPGDIAILVRAQLDAIKRAHVLVRRLRDAVAA